MTTLQLSVSNLAWEREHDLAVSEVLTRHGLSTIDIAPGRYFKNPACAGEQDIEIVRRWWQHRGITIVGMQSLLYGTHGLNMFGSRQSQDEMLNHLRGVCRTAALMGAKNLTFGSPRNRDASGWTPSDAFAHAVEFFSRVAVIAEAHGVTVCIEANARAYQCNFLTTTEEAAAVVRSVGMPGIRLQLDTGTMTANLEDAQATIVGNAALIGHIHASEPGLAPLDRSSRSHMQYGDLLRRYLSSHFVTVEMLPSEDRVSIVNAALETAIRAYGRPSGNLS